MTSCEDELDRRLVVELTGPVDPRIAMFARLMVGTLQPVGVLFYGSGLRNFDPSGLFDFYVIVDGLGDWPASSLARFANRVLPPNVHYVALDVGGVTLRAKVALLTLEQFRKLSSPASPDTTIWARFCQPVRLVWVRDPDAADALLEVVRRCVMTASGWAALLGKGRQKAEEWWRTLFARTYAAELRVESSGRARVIMDGQQERFSALLPLAWRAAGISYAADGKDVLQPVLSERQRARALRRWRRIAARGRWLNVARLVKAAFTFRDGARYLEWKIERHSGLKLELSSFEARHPLICLPQLLWRARSVLRRGSL